MGTVSATKRDVISRAFSSCIDGFEGRLVLLESSKQNSLPQIQITGLPNEVVQESRERVKASLLQLGFSVPSQKLLVHLSPAETKKSGSHFDLPIAMTLLTLEGFFPTNQIERTAFLGELSLGGKVRPVKHLIPLLDPLIRNEQIERILVPKENQEEAALFRSSKVFLCEDLREAIGFCFQKQILQNTEQPLPANKPHPSFLTFDSILGQRMAKRVLIISLAGNHPLLLEGPPGSGKTLLANCTPSLLPSLSEAEILEVSRIYSLGGIERAHNPAPPFRSPHHSISAAAFLGGGSGQVLPGEISFAHRGVLFLDELPEFRRDAIEGLREPLQDGKIHLHRISQSIRLPANFRLIAAMNPCRCGYSGNQFRTCSCSAESLRSYRKRLSGPILDRFPLYFWLEATKTKLAAEGASHSEAREAIGKVHPILALEQPANEDLTALQKRLNRSASLWLRNLEEKTSLSFRRLSNLLKVSRTIALLDERESIESIDLEEAWNLRSPEVLT